MQHLFQEKAVFATKEEHIQPEMDIGSLVNRNDSPMEKPDSLELIERNGTEEDGHFADTESGETSLPSDESFIYETAEGINMGGFFIPVPRDYLQRLKSGVTVTHRRYNQTKAWVGQFIAQHLGYSTAFILLLAVWIISDLVNILFLLMIKALAVASVLYLYHLFWMCVCYLWGKITKQSETE